MFSVSAPLLRVITVSRLSRHSADCLCAKQTHSFYMTNMILYPKVSSLGLYETQSCAEQLKTLEPLCDVILQSVSQRLEYKLNSVYKMLCPCRQEHILIRVLLRLG